MNILLTNDDGFDTDLITGLASTLTYMGHNVTIVAPLTNQSAVAHAVTLHKAISVYPQSENIYAVDGTPVDCMFLALNAILENKPDLVVSGINYGPNYGDDIFYSGTVAAAREAFMKGFRAISISRLNGDNLNDSETVHVAANIINDLLQYPMDHYYFNVNIPNVKNLKYSYEFGHVSQKRRWKQAVSYVKTANKVKSYKIGGTERKKNQVFGSDSDILSRGVISVTPLDISVTNLEILTLLIGQDKILKG